MRPANCIALGAGLTIDARVAFLAKEHEIFVIAPFSRVLSRTKWLRRLASRELINPHGRDGVGVAYGGGRR